MFRYFFALCLVAVITVAVSAEVDETPNIVSVDDEAQNYSIQTRVAVKLIGKVAAGMAASCVLEAGQHCMQHWRHISALLNCAKEFFKANKGRCALGGK